MKIDAHHHLWDLNAVHYPWLMAKGEPRFFGDPAPIQRDYLLEEFIRDAKAQGFEGSVHVQVGAADPLAEAQWVQSVANANPDWPMAQVAFCDLTAPDAEAQLDVLQDLPTVRGVRQIIGRAPGEDAVTGTNALLDNPMFLARLQGLAKRGLSFDLQLLPELMQQTAAVLARATDTQVALCHAGSPHDRSPEGLDYWAQQLSYLSELQNVACKLSGLGMFEPHWNAQSVAPIVETILSQFSPKRCMVGSNFPVDSLNANYDVLMENYRTLVPQADVEDVFGSTASWFYGLR
ncbi:amidohydrolase family protein [Epibacterium ulvae]|uniref:amidohydrolase family protein n=1 Tax=Epibacterium ulvae TaxID=1156985 RepID=UPI00248F59D6|nr:amidohydrolase family protein [Epibacterium ulvae]